MTYGTHIRGSRHGTLYFRYVIPPDVRTCGGKSEISVSLGTASKREAALACLELELAAKRIVAAARESALMNPEDRSELHAQLVELRRETDLANAVEAERQRLKAEALKLIAVHHVVFDRRLKVEREDRQADDQLREAQAVQIESLTAKFESLSRACNERDEEGGVSHSCRLTNRAAARLEDCLRLTKGEALVVRANRCASA
jgi:hypothetical protein